MRGGIKRELFREEEEGEEKKEGRMKSRGRKRDREEDECGLHETP